ncbi:MAG: M56 family metallopeptidase [Planctomycetota bacterium]
MDSSTLLTLILSVSLAGTVVVGSMLLLQVLIKNRVSPTFLYVCWAIALLRFVIVWTPESPTSLSGLWQPITALMERNHLTPKTETTSISGAERQAIQSLGARALRIENYIPAQNELVPAVEASSAQSTEIQIDRQAATFETTPPSPRWEFQSLFSLIVLGIWATGVLWCLGRLLFQSFFIARLIRNSEPAPEYLGDQFNSVLKSVGCWLPVQIRCSDQLESPSVTGIFRPTILIPSCSLDELNERDMQLVLLHELIHVRRFDGLWQIIGYLIASIHWFNPLAQLANYRLAGFRELSCDRAVVNCLSTKESNRQACDEDVLIQAEYGHTILKLAQLTAADHESDQKRFPTTMLFGFIGKEEFIIKQRIKMLVQSPKLTYAGCVTGFILLAVLIAVGFTSQPQVAAQQIGPPTQANPKLKSEPKLELTFENIGIETIKDLQSVNQTPRSIQPQPAPLNGENIKLPGMDVSVKRKRHRNRIDDRTTTIRLSGRKTIEFELKEGANNFRFDPTLLLLEQVDDRTITLTGLKPGVCTISYQVDDTTREVEAEVLCDTRAVQRVLDTAYPSQNLRVDGTPSKMALLRGFVKDESAGREIENSIRQVTELVIVNQLTVANPIAFQLKIYKFDTKKFRELGINIGIPHPNESKAFKQVQTFSEVMGGSNASIDSSRLNLQSLKFLKALEKQNVVTLVEDPTLVSVNGQTAEFLSGGEIPIKVGQGDQETLEFRDFGTKVELIPQLNGQNQLTLEIKAEFSELDSTLGNSDKSPGFRVRRVNTGTNIEFGQTFCLSGELFANQSNEELVLLITPTKVTSN